MSAKFFGDIENPELTLEKTGWIKVYENGTLYWGRNLLFDLWEVVTQNQQDFLLNLERVSTGKYKDRIENYLYLISMNKKDIS